MSEINRRQFVTLVAGAVACGCCAESVAEEKAQTPKGPVEIGAAADYPNDGAVDKFARSHKLLVVREQGRLYAPTAICTHKQCTLKLKDGQIRCPCHFTLFSNEGIPLPGGKTDAPLVRYAIIKRDDGQLVVDTRTSFTQEQWADPASFVVLE